MTTIKNEIDDLSKDEETKILTEAMPALCRELLGDEACKEEWFQTLIAKE